MDGRRKRFGNLNKKIQRGHNSPSNIDIGFIAESSYITEGNLIDTALPAIHIGEGNVCVSLLFLLVIHYFDFVE